RQMVRDGLISRETMLGALSKQRKVQSRLGEILVAEGALRREDLVTALGRQHNVRSVDLNETPPKAEMSGALSADVCVTYGVVPWKWVDRTMLVATSRPDRFKHVRKAAGIGDVHILPVIADPIAIRQQIGRLYAKPLAAKALVCVPEEDSCRSMGFAPLRRMALAACVFGLLIAAMILAPAWTVTVGVLFCMATMTLACGLKLLALLAPIFPKQGNDPLVELTPAPPITMPRVSVLVPLYNEPRVVVPLIERLSHLTYPKSLLEIVLVLEAKDTATREALDQADLPAWFNVIEVPDDGAVTTKPRAMNYALDFCTGSIIGVWDAEDAPEADQIEKVVMQFAEAPDNVACLQGILDYYNPRANWIARCFTIEYAAWWRVMIPGMARLGLVLPLGGTTLFFRRRILEQLGRWDAHNVTEDADLGVRLARHGYRTELLHSVTFEEANCRPWRWVRQRSRWLKGFLITWMVHMRRPAELVRQLGFWRVLGLQTVLFVTFVQFAAGPLLWSLWFLSFAIDHPVMHTMGNTFVTGMIVFFIAAEVLNLILHSIAVTAEERRHLLLWTLTMPFYFLVGALAAYKALWELVRAPFFWDKTEHGLALPQQPMPRPAGARRPVADGS
ncbi:MAG: glycosyltransferase, partial [Pseudomonadota bacterium]